MHISAQPIQLGDRTLAPLGLGQGGGELRPAIERVGTLAGLDLGELGGDRVALAAGKMRIRRALGLEAKAASALFLGGNANVNWPGGFYGRAPMRPVLTSSRCASMPNRSHLDTRR